MVGAVGIEHDPIFLSPAISRRCNRLPNSIADSADSILVQPMVFPRITATCSVLASFKMGMSSSASFQSVSLIRSPGLDPVTLQSVRAAEAEMNICLGVLSCPLPQTREDGVIDASERAFAHHVPMIVRPTANLWVELIDQIGGRHAMCRFVRRMSSRKVPRFFLEGLMSSFPLGYLRTFCPRKSKPCST
jgi:hypothetical protein